MADARLRFRLNFAKGKDTVAETTNAFSRYVIREVALGYADGLYGKVRDRVAQRFRADVIKEINRAASSYGKLALGSTTPGFKPGSWTSAAAGGPVMNTGAYRGMWASQPRKPTYEARKYRKHRHKRWLWSSGKLAGVVGRGGFWTDVFGGVEIAVYSHRGLKLGGQQLFAKAGKGSSTRVAVATIHVKAMDRLGDDFENVRDLVFGADEEIGYKLAGGIYHYRKSLEPFLEFTLRQTIPHAISKRLEGDLLLRRTRSSGLGSEFVGV